MLLFIIVTYLTHLFLSYQFAETKQKYRTTVIEDNTNLAL